MRVLHVGWGFQPWRAGGLIEYAEDLMQAQLGIGHEIGYFFAGRHYPFFTRPRLRIWRRRGVRMYEVLNALIYPGGDSGIRNPDSELNDVSIERLFSRVLDQFRPSIIHIQELFGATSSLIEIAKASGAPVVMTLSDYYLLCPTLKLYDYAGARCTRRMVGDTCVRCCAGAPEGPRALIASTLHFEYERARRFLPVLLQSAKFLWHHATRSSILASLTWKRATNPGAELSNESEAFQRRRDVNLRRLGKVDVLISLSTRTRDIYRSFGISGDKSIAMQTAVQHTDSIRPVRIRELAEPINFVTLNGCASMQKGAGVILQALDCLARNGLQERFKLFILGGLLDIARPALLKFPNVTYRGPYRVAELDRLLDGMHVGIVSSVWEEAYGYVGIEMLAKGIPVVGNKIGGITDYVVDGTTGWLNRTKDGAGLAEIMSQIIHHPEEILDRNRYILSRRDAIIKPMSRHVAEIEEVYRDVCGKKFPGACQVRAAD